jgi:hypothetical protein
LDAAGVPLDAGEDLSICCWPRIPLDAGKDDLSTRRRAHIPLDAGEDLTTHLWRFWMLLVSHWMPARICVPLDAVGDLSTCLRLHFPLDAAGPTQDGHTSVNVGEDLTTHLRRFGMLLVSHWMPARIRVPLDAVGDPSTNLRPHFPLDVLCVQSRFSALLK